ADVKPQQALAFSFSISTVYLALALSFGLIPGFAIKSSVSKSSIMKSSGFSFLGFIKTSSPSGGGITASPFFLEISMASSDSLNTANLLFLGPLQFPQENK
ncbi:hypothetical protein, partial [Sansalvadorimonas verongulae]|uniref:hypothetical protein n=1 Tax=Sansalvadorimonas verongulae TaxID=2172824 RepID=UPI001E658862